LFGTSESILRLPSLLAGVCSLLLFVPLAFRWLERTPACCAIALFAVSPTLIGYSGEFKQYECDVALSVTLALLGSTVIQDSARRDRMLVLALAGSAAIWFSHPTVFVLGGLGLAGLYSTRTNERQHSVHRWLLAIGFWLASFGTSYVLVTHKLGLNEYMQHFWAGKFLPLPPTTAGDLLWIVHHFFEFVDQSCGLSSPKIGLTGIAGFGLLAGMLVAVKSHRPALILFMGPLFLAMIASGFHRYPFAGRLLLFAVPGAFIIVTLGVQTIARSLGKTIPGLPYVLYGLIFLAPLHHCWQQRALPLHSESTREALAYIQSHRQESDYLIVSPGAVPAVHYYRNRFPMPESQLFFTTQSPSHDPNLLLREWTLQTGTPRVWLLLSHFQADEENAVRLKLAERGYRAEPKRFPGVLIWLIDTNDALNTAQLAVGRVPK
jgi:uncharacterized membrane protein